MHEQLCFFPLALTSYAVSDDYIENDLGNACNYYLPINVATPAGM
jgi:hypothetical protein